MSNYNRPLLASALALLVSGCIDFSGSNSGGGPGGNFDDLPSSPTAPTDLCTPVAGGASRLTTDSSACPGCSIDNPDAAFDGRLDSVATLVFSPLGRITLNGQLQTGVVLPGDTAGGIALQLASDATVVLTVTTLLDGEPTGTCLSRIRAGFSDATGTGMNCSNRFRSGEPSFLGVISSSPYNEIQAELDYGDVGLDNTVPVFELCMR